MNFGTSMLTEAQLEQQKAQLLVEPRCSCCGALVVKEPFDLCIDPLELDYLGSGYPLYFDFLKYCGWFLILLILTAGAYSFLSNGYGKYCTDSTTAPTQNQAGVQIVCPKQFWTTYSFVNKVYSKEFFFFNKQIFYHPCIL
jgi:hypothetical protein